MCEVAYNRELKVSGEFDVVVVGGGPAGIFAAITAARNGAKTALVEQYGFLGGNATAALVTPISKFKKNGEIVVNGAAWEFVQRLKEIGGAVDDYENGNVPVDTEKFKLMAQRMVLEAGVTLYLHTYFSDVIANGGTVDSVVVTNKDGLTAIKCKYVIDCTGDADVAVSAGMPTYEINDVNDLQPASLCFRVGGVEMDKMPSVHPRGINMRAKVGDIRAKLQELKESGAEKMPNYGGPWFCTVLNDEAGIVNINFTRSFADASDATSVTQTEITLREDVFTLFEILKKHIDGFQNSYLLYIAPTVGYRESRRIIGNYTLEVDKYIEAYKFEDSVARGAHLIDIHRANDNNQDVQFLDKSGYIPYSCMIKSGFSNIIVAGRCISVDKRSFGSTRVMGTAMALGQAAGTAAAICCEDKVSTDKISIEKLRNKMIEQGANI